MIEKEIKIVEVEENINQDISPVAPVEDVPTPSVNQPPFGSWWKVGILVVGVLLAGTISYAGYQYSQKQIPPISKPTPTPVAVATPTPDPTANWKTYTNTKYNFSFKYPQEFSLQIEDKNVTDQPKVFLRFVNTKITENYPVFDVVLVKTSLGPKEWIRNQNYCPGEFDSCTPLKSGSVPQSVQYDSINRHYAGINTLFTSNGILFDFSFGATAPDKPIEESARNIYNQILSTFKFLD